jgi:3-hydroxyisobutyrate dehydrogenase-like beta-hydroxyacid dehydrogenase
MKLGFIGIGAMGSHMTVNLINAGYDVTVFDIRKEAMEYMMQFGAKLGSSPSDVARKSNIILTSLPTTNALEDVVLGEHGMLESMKCGSILIDTSTVSPSTIQKIGLVLKEQKVSVLEAPVSGGVEGAEAGTLTIMVGGSVDVFQRCHELLQVIGKNIYHVGGLGSGNTVKLVNNLMSLVNVVTLSEGMVLGVKAGVDAATLYNVIKVSTGRSQALEWKLPNKILPRNFEPGFTIDLTYKDLSLVLSLAKELGVPLFVTSIAQQVYALAKAKGLGKLDNTAVITLFEEASKIIVAS